ncbi:hypothetical protein TNCV_3199311 [Trichonephila clavipes]|nr:hypothetical protein TNCV_3199311 [Trichonephila clavipes]
MPWRNFNLGCNTRKAKSVRRSNAHQNEERRTSAKEQNRQRMAQVHAVEAAELQMTERRQQVTAYQPYNHLAFRYMSVDDYSLSRHVLIGTKMFNASSLQGSEN